MHLLSLTTIDLLEGVNDHDGPPTEIADLVSFSFPLAFIADSFGKRQVLDCEKMDAFVLCMVFLCSVLLMVTCRDLLDGLKSRGFKLNRGTYDAGAYLNAWGRRGGHYIGGYSRGCSVTSTDYPISDIGASQLIIDGKIKVKNGSQIERFTRTGLKFEDGSELTGDVIVFATG